MIEELYEQYGQFLVIGLVLLVAFGVYFAHKYYYNKENVEESGNANSNSEQKNQVGNNQAGNNQPRNNQAGNNRPRNNQAGNNRPREFVPSKEFRGQQPGYTFKNGNRGQGYYID